MRLALMQTPPTPDPATALARLAEGCTAARAAGAQLLVTPEMFLSGYAVGRAALEVMESPLETGLWADAAAIARDAGIAVLTGGPEAGGYNTAALFDAEGAHVATCRKTHLYGDVDRAQFVAGDALSPVFDFGGLRCAIAICSTARSRQALPARVSEPRRSIRVWGSTSPAATIAHFSVAISR